MRGPGTRTRRALLPALALAALAPRLASGEEDAAWDPLEGFNRGIFAVNEWLDIHALEPVARAWDFVMPDPALRGIRNVFDNARYPIHLVNNLLQGKPRGAMDETARFLINTTVGIGGLFDAAGDGGLPARVEDFGQTLGVWGVPAGPYLVIPILGPSSFRDAGGLIVDTGSGVYTWFVPFYASLGAASLRLFNLRTLALDEIAAERSASLDFYASSRNAYLSYRRNQVRDGESDPDAAAADDLYYFEDLDE